MAKVGGLVTISGRVGDVVMTKGGRYGKYMRKAVGAGTKKNEPGLKEQYVRSAYLNQLASQVNTVIGARSGRLKPSNFYQQVLKRIRKEKQDNRLLLLHRLKGMDVNESYRLSAHVGYEAGLSHKGKKVTVLLKIDHHLSFTKLDANCYYLQVSLVTWQQKGEPDCETQYSEWVGYTDKEPTYEFEYDKPKGALHWLLCVRVLVGVNKLALDMVTAEGMQLAAASKMERPSERTAEKIVKRVKPKNS